MCAGFLCALYPCAVGFLLTGSRFLTYPYGRLFAILIPIIPVPINPIFIFTSHIYTELKLKILKSKEIDKKQHPGLDKIEFSTYV